MVPTHPWVDLELLEPAILASKFLNAAYTRRAGKVFDQGRQQTLERELTYIIAAVGC
jgi:hypothetical protein